MEKKCCANPSCGSALLLGSAVLFQNMLAEWNQKLLHIIYLNTCMCEQELCLQDREVQPSQSAWCSCYFTWYDIIFILWASIWNCWCHKVCHDTYWLDSIDDRWYIMPRSFHKTITQYNFWWIIISVLDCDVLRLLLLSRQRLFVYSYWWRSKAVNEWSDRSSSLFICFQNTHKSTLS